MATREWNITLAILLGISFHHAVSGQLRMKPENVAAVVGADVVLQCQGPTDDPNAIIIWYEYIRDPLRRSTVSTRDTITIGIPNYDLYSISGDPALAQYHLNIKLAIVSGGRYECNEPIAPFQASAYITVLESIPVCSDTIQADGVVEEGDTITYTCEVAYNSTSIDWPPVMTWTGPDGTITDVIKLSTSGGRVSSSVDVTGAPGLNGAVYSVLTHFEAYGGTLPDGHATNVPTYSHSHSFNALLVHYSPRDIAFRPDRNTYNPGDRLTCSAVGNPAVSYKWYNSTDNSTLVVGAELTVREEMNGLTCGCEAYNTIMGIKRSLNKEFTLTVTKSTEPTTTEALTPFKCSDPSPGVVAGIVIAAILLLGILIVSSLFLWRTRNTPCEKCKQKSSQHHPANSNGNHGVYETPYPSGITTQPSEYTELSFT